MHVICIYIFNRNRVLCYIDTIYEVAFAAQCYKKEWMPTQIYPIIIHTLFLFGTIFWRTFDGKHPYYTHTDTHTYEHNLKPSSPLSGIEWEWQSEHLFMYIFFFSFSLISTLVYPYMKFCLMQETIKENWISKFNLKY